MKFNILSPLQCKKKIVPNIDGTYNLWVRSTAKVPVNFRVSFGTTLNELRACLDSLACALAVKNGKSDKGVYFPISASRTIFEGDGYRKMRKLSQDDQNIIANLKPYKGGNNGLFHLHRADILRKHIRLLPFAGSLAGVNFENALVVENMHAVITNCTVNGRPTGNIDTNPSGSTVAEINKPILIGTNVGANISPLFSVVCEAPDELMGMHIALLMRESCAQVDQIINRLT